VPYRLIETEFKGLYRIYIVRMDPRLRGDDFLESPDLICTEIITAYFLYCLIIVFYKYPLLLKWSNEINKKV